MKSIILIQCKSYKCVTGKEKNAVAKPELGPGTFPILAEHSIDSASQPPIKPGLQHSFLPFFDSTTELPGHLSSPVKYKCLSKILRHFNNILNVALTRYKKFLDLKYRL